MISKHLGKSIYSQKMIKCCKVAFNATKKQLVEIVDRVGFSRKKEHSVDRMLCYRSTEKEKKKGLDVGHLEESYTDLHSLSLT